MPHDDGSYYDPADAEADLADLDGAYQGAETPTNDFTPVPDGRYQVLVDAVELKKSRSNNPMLAWTLKILGPHHEGRLLFTRNMLMTEKNMVYLKKNLEICGLHLQKLSDLAKEETLTRLLDVELEVSKKTQRDDPTGENYDVYFNKKIDTRSAAAGGEGAPF